MNSNPHSNDGLPPEIADRIHAAYFDYRKACSQCASYDDLNWPKVHPDAIRHQIIKEWEDQNENQRNERT